MTKAFDRISAGLGEARAFAQGKKVKGLKLHTREIANHDVAAVRLKVGLTQEQFAELIGSSIGTVRKWETGERRPSGAAARLLHLLDSQPKIVTKPWASSRHRQNGRREVVSWWQSEVK
jgi:putative transcriptional regulator